MKKRSKKGMALASTLIMMSIVMMMCTLMVTVTLYASQVTALNMQNVEDRRVLDDIGNCFLNNKNNPDNALITIKNENSGMKYIDGQGNELAELTLSNGSKAIKGTMDGMYITIKLEETGNVNTLTVTGARRGNQLLKIQCTKTTDERTDVETASLKSWSYGN